jgi:predicted Zn finger-like uncharacterized protein
MRLRCPTCSTRYELAVALIGEGRKLRCAACRESWHASPSDDVSSCDEAPGAPDTLMAWDAARAIEASPDSASTAEGDGICEAQGLNEAGRSVSPAAATRLDIVTDVRSERSPPRPRPARPASPARLHLPRLRLRRLAARLCVLALPGLCMAAVAQKDLMVHLVPQTAALFKAIGLTVNLRGLALADVHGTLDALDGASVLTLQARISNLREALTPVPAIRIAVRDKDHRELYSWTARAPKARLGAGESLLFRNRLAAPPEGAVDVVVSFVDASPQQDVKIQAAGPPEDGPTAETAPDKVARMVDQPGPATGLRIRTGMR